MLNLQEISDLDFNYRKEILVLDDCIDTLGIIKNFLIGAHNLKVSYFLDEKDAISSCSFIKPDLAIIDMNLNSMDGIRFSLLLQQINSQSIPMIFISQDFDKKFEVENFYGHNSTFLCKPLDQELLKRTIIDKLLI